MGDANGRPHCIAFGIPTTREEFFRSFSPPASDYTRQWTGGWAQYRAQFVADLDIVTPDLEGAGVSLVRGLRLVDLANLFSRYRVVVLFSHWTRESVEFFDGLAATEKILPEIPSTYDGVFDLCVCHPIGLVEKLLSARPAYSVKYAQAEANPRYWLYLYRDIFRHMQAAGCGYLQAFEAIARAHIALSRNQKEKR